MKERVLQYILDFGSVSTWDAIKDLGCTRLSAYIYMLKKEELKKVLIQDFYIDTLEVAKVLGKVKKII